MPKSKNTHSIRSQSKKSQRKMSKPKNTVHSISKRKIESKSKQTDLINLKSIILNYFNSKGVKYINTVVNLDKMKIDVEPVREMYKYNPIKIFKKVLKAPKLKLPLLLIDLLCEVFRRFIFQLWDGVSIKSTLLLLSPIQMLNQIYELFPNDNIGMAVIFQPCKLIINILDLMDDRLKLYSYVQLTGLYVSKTNTEHLNFIHKCDSLEYDLQEYKKSSYFLKPETPLLIFYLPINTTMRTQIKYLFIYSHSKTTIELAKKSKEVHGLQISNPPPNLINIIEEYYSEKNDVNISLVMIDQEGLKYQLNKNLTNKSVDVKSQSIGKFIETLTLDLLPVFMGTLNKNPNSSVNKILENPLYEQRVWNIINRFYSGSTKEFQY